MGRSTDLDQMAPPLAEEKNPPSLPRYTRLKFEGSIHIACSSTCAPLMEFAKVAPPSSERIRFWPRQKMRSGLLGTTAMSPKYQQKPPKLLLNVVLVPEPSRLVQVTPPSRLRYRPSPI